MSRSRVLMRAIGAGIAFAALVAAGSAGAQAATAGAPASHAPAAAIAGKPMWKDLSKPQQVALDPLQAEWDQMDASRKRKWLEIANRYSSMKVDEQQRVQERMRDWLKLTPEERRQARENYTLSKKIDKGEKSAQWEQYQALPDEEKRKLAAEAAIKKQVTNLPPKAQPKAIAPIKPGKVQPVTCASGMIKNTSPAGPACVPLPVPPPVAVPAAGSVPQPIPPLTSPAPANPAVPVPVPNVK